MKQFRTVIAAALLVCMVSVMLPCGALAASERTLTDGTGYTDIQGTWFEKWAAVYGDPNIFKSDDGKFYPHKTITRMEFARMLHTALGININYLVATDISDYYADVTNDDEGAGELYDLVTCGIIDGTGSFHPAQTLDRQEMIHLIQNAFYYVAGSDYAIADQGREPYGDQSKIGAAYQTDVSCAAALGLVNGRGNNLICPDETATRAEAVTVAGRLAELKHAASSDVVIKASAAEEDGELVLTLSVRNNTDQTISIDHGGQSFDFVMFDQGGHELYRWSEGKMFIMLMTTTQIAAGKELIFTDKVDAKTYASLKDSIASIKGYLSGVSSAFTINEYGYYIRPSF